MPNNSRRRPGVALNAAVGKTSAQTLDGRLNWFATLLANRGRWPLRQWRYKPARHNAAVVHLIMLDTSASTLQGRGLAKAKAAVLAIARKAYLRREQLLILGFGNQQVNLLLPLLRAPKYLQQWLDALQAGGGTPLAEVLQQAADLQKQHLRKNAQLDFRNYLITDGRVRSAALHTALAGQTLVLDVEQSAVKRGRGGDIARALRAAYYCLPA